MRGFYAVARREVVEKRGLFVGAVVLSLLTLAAPLLPGTRRYPASEVRFWTALFFGFAFTSVLSVVLGSTTIGRDLSEHRIAFYFSRPIGSAAIWTGKLAAAAVLIVAGTVLIFLPAAILDREAWKEAAKSSLSIAEWAILFLASVVFCLALGNVVSGALRAKSAWALGDLVLLVVWAGVLAAVAQPLWRNQRGPLLELGIAIAVSVSASLLIASGAQVAVGRVDIARGNRARFTALWGTLALATFAAAGYVRWFVSASPSDLLHPWVSAAPGSGSWIAVDGLARGRGNFPFAFLYDVNSGRFLRLSAGREPTVLFSADGRTAAWAEQSLREPPALFVGRLDAKDPKPMETRISVPVLWRGDLSLNEDGTRIALLDGKTVAVHEVPSGRLLVSAAIPTESDDRDGGWRLLTFPDRDLIRIYRVRSFANDEIEARNPGQVEIFELDVARRSLRRAAVLGPFERPFYPSFDDSRGRILIRQRDKATDVFDCSTGAHLAALDVEPLSWRKTRFLSDGRIAAGFVGPTGQAYLRIFAADGKEQRQVSLGPAGSVRIGGEPAPGQLVVATAASPSGIENDAHLVGLSSGTERLIGKGLSPVASSLWSFPQQRPGSVITRLFFRADDSLALLDPPSGKLRVLLPKGSSR